MFYETSVVTRATWFNTPKDIYHCWGHENFPEGSFFDHI
jgi:hypothetical protein